MSIFIVVRPEKACSAAEPGGSKTFRTLGNLLQSGPNEP